jgi:hypothetical protein
MKGHIFEEKSHVELISDKRISPLWIEYFLRFATSAEDLSNIIVKSKTANRVLVDKNQEGAKVFAYFKSNDRFYNLKVNNKAFPGPSAKWTYFNISSGLDRLKLKATGNFPFILNPNSESFRHLTTPMFEKNAFKIVYSAPLSLNIEKVQFGYKQIQNEFENHSKYFFGLAKIFGVFSTSFFRTFSKLESTVTKFAFKAKYKSDTISCKSLPEGHSQTLKLQHGVFSPENSDWHVKGEMRGYQSFSFLPGYSNLEYQYSLLVSNHKTRGFQNVAGFPLVGIFGPSDRSTAISNYFLLKFNCYDILKLKDYRISPFAFYSYIKGFGEFGRHEAGCGLEKHFKNQNLRVQLFYGAFDGNFQIRFSKE